MGNRANLNIDDREAVFEANNSLPGFWIGLLDQEIFEAHANKWRRIALLSEDEQQEFDYSIEVSADRGLKNLDAARDTIKKLVPGVDELLDDFIQFLEDEAHFEIGLDLIEIANFTSLDEFIESVDSEVAILSGAKNGELRYFDSHDPIAMGCGFDGSSSESFSAQSSKYREFLVSRRVPKSPPLPTPKRKTSLNKKALLVASILLLICPIFTWIVYRGWLEDGFSIQVVGLGAANIFFYSFLSGLVYEQIKAWKAKK